MYLTIGFIVILFSIYKYRKDRQTQKKNELYLAVLGILLWPIVLLKHIYDLTIKQKTSSK